MVSVEGLIGERIVVSEKLDGSNLSMTSDHLFARSHTALPQHVSFDWAKQAHAALKHLIPTNWSVFFEYTYAVHTIVYDGLSSYLWVIGVRDDETSFWLPWNDVESFSREELLLPTVPVLWRGIVTDEESLRDLTTCLGSAPGLFGEREGVVARVERGFSEREFGSVVGKWVRAGHVPADALDWWKRPVQRQRLVRRT
jgi:hypothetical protein